MYRQARYDRRMIFERGGGSDFSLPEVEWTGEEVPPQLRRKGLELPSVPEREVVKHYTNLSQMNFGVDNGFYPLGSCTMKYNPKYGDLLASLPQVASVHPYQSEESIQGALALMHELERALCRIGGMDAVTLQPAAGAHGEFTGMLLARAYHESLDRERDQVIVPDTAHGTNPASAAMAGFEVVEIPSSDEGMVDPEALESALSERTAALMITNPNTLGIFERGIKEVARAVHDVGALLYYDGANLNAVMGITDPGMMDFDIVHFNLHKTFSTPHGGGGPGSGPVGVVSDLEPFLPVPRVIREGDRYTLDYDRPRSIGKVRSYLGNFAVMVRAYAYILRMGGEGLRRASERAVLNSNYLKERVKEHYDLPFGNLRKHEFVIGAGRLKRDKGLRALDVAKRLLDHGMHPPTIYFPSLVEEALMIEPTETEEKETLDMYADALIGIAEEDPETLTSAPSHTSVRRVDEVFAAKEAILSYRALKKRSDQERGKEAVERARRLARSGVECQLCAPLLRELED
ncbi:MAG: aminomethyl-transferring glycine dehydrogenase subunit GcvPB [Methanomassiliicoccales archaeon]